MAFPTLVRIVPNAVPIGCSIFPIPLNIFPISAVLIEPKKLDMLVFSDVNAPINLVIVLLTPSPNLLNTFSSNVENTELNAFPNPEVTDNKPDPILGSKLPRGLNALITLPIALPTVLKTSNNPLNVSFIFLAVSSFILNLYVKSLNLVDNSVSFSPVIEGNTSFQASPIPLSPLPRLCIILVKPLIAASLPPDSFQNFNMLFLASVEGPINFSNP